MREMDLSENEELDKMTEKAANHEETILVAKEFDSVTGHKRRDSECRISLMQNR